VLDDRVPIERIGDTDSCEDIPGAMGVTQDFVTRSSAVAINRSASAL
jgi:hypothetical protein